MKNRVVLTGTLGNLTPNQIKELERQFYEKMPNGEFEYLNDIPVSEDVLIPMIKEANVIMTTYQKITDKVYASVTPALKACIALGIGYDSANVTAASKYNVAVANIPDYCIQEVALHTVMMILATHRGLLPTIRALDEGRWTERFAIISPVCRFNQVTIGLFGFGNIAKEVAKMLSGFRIQIISYDPYINKYEAEALGVIPVDFDTLVKESDYLLIHAPLLPGTTKVINEKVFNNMKNDAVLINTSRGGLVDSDALYEALTKGKIRGAALDVFATEPPIGIEAEICMLPNVLSTPHIAFYSDTAIDEFITKGVDEAVRVLRGERPINLINKEIEQNLTWIKR
jgi:D-3-phosphoglycerate dehydrogenase